jgi:hypothetical protein
MAQFRSYNPNVGRWLSRDPSGEMVNQNGNLYSYVDNNPVNYFDVFGLWGVQFGSVNLGVGHPNLHFTGESWGDLADGAMAATDGIIPFADPFADNGKYDDCDKALQTSQMLGAFSRDVGLAALSGGAGLARGGSAKILAGGRNSSGIYQFATSSGRQYVGQSGNIGRRLAQHGSRVGGNLKRWKVGGNKLAREVAEQARIDKLGGIKNLANKVNPLGKARQHLNNPKLSAEGAAAIGGALGLGVSGVDALNNSGCE